MPGRLVPTLRGLLGSLAVGLASALEAFAGVWIHSLNVDGEQWELIAAMFFGTPSALVAGVATSFVSRRSSPSLKTAAWVSLVTAAITFLLSAAVTLCVSGTLVPFASYLLVPAGAGALPPGLATLFHLREAPAPSR